jgi:hypothetical protein
LYAHLARLQFLHAANNEPLQQSGRG